MAQATSEPAGAPLEGWHAVLDQVGERVRRLRIGRAMSRKALAHHAHVSERHLAQLESGRGNLSLLLLKRIAAALGVPLAELVAERERPAEARRIERLLDGLSVEQIEEAFALLTARFGGTRDLGARRRDRIALIGLRGGGKSTIGRLVAAEFGAPFIELDRRIEEESGTRLAEMFELFGQETFRRAERAALEGVLREHARFVLATGGGLVTEPGTFDLLLTACFTVWVRADPEAHMARVIAQGDLRPMADNSRAMEDLLAILQAREPLYAKADAVLDTSGKTPQACVREVMGRLA
jgi:XRE family transcriptional regulator, aerobic/anaerobic benzoate catabolism transcriptional regulator